MEKNFEPNFILKKLEKYKKVENGKVIFQGPDLFEYLVILETMLDFRDDLATNEKSELISHTINSFDKTIVNSENFEKVINQKLKSYNLENKESYELLTTISINPPFELNDVVINDCKISIFSSSFDKKYDSRKDFLKKELRFTTNPQLLKSYLDDERKFCKVIVSTKAHSISRAGEQCLKSLNSLRFISCCHSNPERSFFQLGSTGKKPLNRIVLGKFHTLHKINGELTKEVVWHEPNYAKVKPHKIKAEQESNIRRDIKLYCDLINKCEDKDKIKITSSILRFVEAYDHVDYHSTLISGWASLEHLVKNGENESSDVIVRRCSFLYEDYGFRQQVLKHIKEYRNKYVYYGKSSEGIVIICHQLQEYFYQMVYFYFVIMKAKEFKSLEDANSFLDLPKSISTLKHRAFILKTAIKYRTAKTA